MSGVDDTVKRAIGRTNLGKSLTARHHHCSVGEKVLEIDCSQNMR